MNLPCGVFYTVEISLLQEVAKADLEEDQLPALGPRIPAATGLIKREVHHSTVLDGHSAIVSQFFENETGNNQPVYDDVYVVPVASVSISIIKTIYFLC